MIPTYQEDKPTNQARATRNKGAQTGQRTGHDYLTVADLSSDPTIGHIRSVRVEDDRYRAGHKAVSLKITLNGVIRLWTVRDNNPNLVVLREAFGPDENEWVDKKLSLVAEEDGHSGRSNIAAEPFEEPKNKKGK